MKPSLSCPASPDPAYHRNLSAPGREASEMHTASVQVFGPPLRELCDEPHKGPCDGQIVDPSDAPPQDLVQMVTSAAVQAPSPLSEYISHLESAGSDCPPAYVAADSRRTSSSAFASASTSAAANVVDSDIETNEELGAMYDGSSLDIRRLVGVLRTLARGVNHINRRMNKMEELVQIIAETNAKSMMAEMLMTASEDTRKRANEEIRRANESTRCAESNAARRIAELEASLAVVDKFLSEHEIQSPLH